VSQVSVSARMSMEWSERNSCRTAGLSRLVEMEDADQMFKQEKFMEEEYEIGPGLVWTSPARRSNRTRMKLVRREKDNVGRRGEK
jgi:hypothetical protein